MEAWRGGRAGGNEVALYSNLGRICSQICKFVDVLNLVVETCFYLFKLDLSEGLVDQLVNFFEFINIFRKSNLLMSWVIIFSLKKVLITSVLCVKG